MHILAHLQRFLFARTLGLFFLVVFLQPVSLSFAETPPSPTVLSFAEEAFGPYGEGVTAEVLLPLAGGKLLVVGSYCIPGVYEPPLGFAILLDENDKPLRHFAPSKTPDLCFRNAVALPDGGAVLAGSTPCTGVESDTDFEMVAVRLSASGEVLWEKKLPMPGLSARVGNLLLLPDSSLLLTGVTTDTGLWPTGASTFTSRWPTGASTTISRWPAGPTTPGNSAKQGFLLGLSLDGAVLWQKNSDMQALSAVLDAEHHRVLLAGGRWSSTDSPTHTTVQEFSFSGEPGRKVIFEGALDISADPFTPERFFLYGTTSPAGKNQPVFFSLNAALEAGPPVFPAAAAHGYITSFLRDTPDSVLVFAPGGWDADSQPAALLWLDLSGNTLGMRPVDDPWPFELAGIPNGDVYIAGRKDEEGKFSSFWLAKLKR